MPIAHSENRFPWLRSVGLSTIAIAALVGIVLLQRSRLNSPSLWLQDPKQAERQEALNLKLIRQMPSFGLENLLADWTFLNFLQYFGDDAARQKTGYALSPDYFDVITRRDPRFVEVYPFLSNSISYQLGKPEQAIQFMRRGTAALSPAINPKAFQLWRFMSLDQLLLLGDIPGAIESLEKAADWVEGTEYAPYGATFRQTANFLRKEPNSKPVRVSAWGSIYEQAVAIGDKQTQQRARREIEALGGRIYEKDGRLYIEPPTTSPAKTNRP